MSLRLPLKGDHAVREFRASVQGGQAGFRRRSVYSYVPGFQNDGQC